MDYRHNNLGSLLNLVLRLSKHRSDNARYILSAISQGLAAILALVFTITLVVAQMKRKYTAMDKIIFRIGTIGLMIIFRLGVVTPLLVLKFGFWGLGVNFSIALAVFCVFSLIPFLKDVNGVLKYEIGVRNLHKEILDQAGRDPILAEIKITKLMEMVRDAVKESNESVVVNTIRGSKHNRLFIKDRPTMGSKETDGSYISFVLKGLKYIGVQSVESRFEKASVYAAKGLTDIVDKAVQSWEGIEVVGRTTTVVIEGLKDIGIKASEKGLKKSEIYGCVAAGLKLIFMKLADKYGDLALNALWCLGTSVMKHVPEKCDQVI